MWPFTVFGTEIPIHCDIRTLYIRMTFALDICALPKRALCSCLLHRLLFSTGQSGKEIYYIKGNLRTNAAGHDNSLSRGSIFHAIALISWKFEKQKLNAKINDLVQKLTRTGPPVAGSAEKSYAEYPEYQYDERFYCSQGR
jgi:hypothetical protein